ncbi:hypothetical protein J2752_000466 [Halarchaeum rubridurum]|uniref:Phage protein D n=1 Tax=Halarchaeum rubridurum TaxID=489911 RepID=A0A830FYU4_9EURY|nr:contractile injection system protein, VgrG/Pvc8 family [Halarchaeum rubridurum]MBP1953585.1 hypothetical protein [Halarchaeum rubridurum]GGM64162.1 hypothetical protein GCM10009017_12780 [Halarchaeum rubridurum]
MSRPIYGAADVGGETAPIVLGGESLPGTQSPYGLTLTQDRWNTSAELEVSLLQDTKPETGSRITCSVTGERIFTGTISSAESRSGWYHVIAHDPIYELKRTTLTQSFQQATLVDIAARALEEAGVDDVSISLPVERTSVEFTGTRCDRVLEKVATWGGGVWYVAADGTVHVTTTIAEMSTAHDESAVVDAAPGDRSMPYQSVRVTGASPASQKGADAMCLISSESLVATAGDGTPRFDYHDDGIRTQAMAENAAQSILEELKRQRATGSITLPGRASIRPFDTLSVPDAIDTQTYLVSGITHRLTSQDGFRTTVTCGGVLAEGSS